LYQVGAHFTKDIDFSPNKDDSLDQSSLTDNVLSALVYIHQSVEKTSAKLKKDSNLFNFVTPRHYLDFISHLSSMMAKKRDSLTEEQSHLAVGLQKLEETAVEVKTLQEILEVKSAQLSEKKSAVLHSTSLTTFSVFFAVILCT
jgi:dynein heavy chain 1